MCMLIREIFSNWIDTFYTSSLKFYVSIQIYMCVGWFYLVSFVLPTNLIFQLHDTIPSKPTFLIFILITTHIVLCAVNKGGPKCQFQRTLNFFYHKIIFCFSHLQTGCVVLHLILHYFLLTNYAWMLCEGFYLHTVLVSAFISEQKLVRWLIVMGWSSPALFLILYGILRGNFSEDHDRAL